MRRRTVLFLEDDGDIAQLGAIAFRASGLDVRLTHTVDDALAACEALVPDVAVVDIQLPGRNGWEFIRHARERFPSVRLVVHSVHGSADPGDEPAVDVYLTKDTTHDQVAERVTDLLRDRSGSPASRG